MRAPLASMILLLLLLVPASAASVESRAGGKASGLTSTMAAKAECLIRGLEAHGAVLKFMGGYRPGHCAQDHKHSCGMAIDICQWSRNSVDSRCHLPGKAVEDEVAARCGLFAGAQWCNADRGHFEDGGSVACGSQWRGNYAKASDRSNQRYSSAEYFNGGASQ